MAAKITKTSFLRGIYFLTSAAFFCVVSIQSAQALTISAPVDSWKIGPIHAKSSSGVGYCSMKNTYDDGKALVFARDAEGSNSVAIDFHKKTLKVGAQYLVGMKVGMVERQMVAIAATPSVLIIQMGLDRTYYETLRRKSVMQISFQGKDMAFALNGTGAALNMLSACAIEVGKGRPFAQVQIATGKISSDKLANDVAAVMPAGDDNQRPDKITSYDKNLGEQSADATLKQEIEKLRAENRRLLLENQAIAARMMAEDKGRHPLAQPDPPEEIIDMTAATTEAPAQTIKEVHVKTSAKAHAKGKAHVVSASIAPVAAAAETPNVEPFSLEPAAGAVVPDSGFLKSLLYRARVTPQIAGKGRYTWKADDIYGGALEGPLPQGADFNHVVQNYLSEARTRCGGDFANKLGLVKTIAGKTVQTGEIACVTGQHDVGAALIFVLDGHNFIVLTYEGTTDQMNHVMSKRKDLLSIISG